ncbi:hypothetical protein DITRI_Ditri12bG0142800 [Diplodiscus trichospermus]
MLLLDFIVNVVVLFQSIPFRDIIIWTEISAAYMDFGLVDWAVEWIGLWRFLIRSQRRIALSYNALMAGFHRNGEGFKIVKLFIEMVEEALLDMCMRCGRIADVEKMFHMWPYEQDSSIVCKSMLGGYARNGQPYNAISCLLGCQLKATMDMDEGDEVLLAAWSEMEEASIKARRNYFDLFCVSGHWGCLEEAEEMIDKMSVEPTASVWHALLDSSRIHFNMPIGGGKALNLYEATRSLYIHTCV